MRERDVQTVLLAAAFEEADADGRVLSAHARARATKEALAAVGAGASGSGVPGADVASSSADASAGGSAAGADRTDEAAQRRLDEAFVAGRASRIVEQLAERVPVSAELLRATRAGAGFVPVVLVLAFLVGLSSNALGDSKTINVLSVPVLVLVAWNLAIYVVFAFGALRSTGARAPDGSAGESGATDAASAAAALSSGADGGWLLRVARWLPRLSWRLPARRELEHGGIVAEASGRYFSAWSSVGRGLLAARARRMLHGGALMLAAGAVLGMYVRGLALEYGAAFESTFLSPEAADRLLGTLLAPASALLGRVVPSVSDGPFANAADWIHLWAATALIFVIVPRALLMLLEGRACARLAADLPLDLGAGPFRRLLHAARGDVAGVRITAYSHHLAPRQLDTLRGMLADVFGPQAEVVVADPLSYGDEQVPPDGTEGRTHCDVILFGLGQTPESEVHARWLSDLRTSRAPDGGMLVLVDGGSYRRRVGDADRLVERRRTWDRVLKEVDVAPVHVDLDRPADPALADAMAASLWSPGSPGSPR